MIKTLTESGVLFLIAWFSPETLVSFVPYQKETFKVTITVIYKYGKDMLWFMFKQICLQSILNAKPFKLFSQILEETKKLHILMEKENRMLAW